MDALSSLGLLAKESSTPSLITHRLVYRPAVLAEKYFSKGCRWYLQPCC